MSKFPGTCSHYSDKYQVIPVQRSSSPTGEGLWINQAKASHSYSTKTSSLLLNSLSAGAMRTPEMRRFALKHKSQCPTKTPILLPIQTTCLRTVPRRRSLLRAKSWLIGSHKTTKTTNTIHSKERVTLASCGTPKAP